MPHFVTKPTQKSRKYYIFSTITMSPISPKMYRSEMEAWLKEHDYRSYLDPKERVGKLMYWNGSFWYVTEEDGYYV